MRGLILSLGLVAGTVWLAPAWPGTDESRDLHDLGFMSGCWRGAAGNGMIIEEFYTVPSENLILGTTRYLRDGRAVQYEFARITRDSVGIVLTPYPGGRPSPAGFELTSLRDGAAVFEAPEHDYPKRIIYRTNPDGSRTARIDGGTDDSRSAEWMMEPVDCGTPLP